MSFVVESILFFGNLHDKVTFNLHGFFGIGEDWRHNFHVSRLNHEKLMARIRYLGYNRGAFIAQSDRSPNDYWSRKAFINHILSLDQTGMNGAIKVLHCQFFYQKCPKNSNKTRTVTPPQGQVIDDPFFGSFARFYGEEWRSFRTPTHKSKFFLLISKTSFQKFWILCSFLFRGLCPWSWVELLYFNWNQDNEKLLQLDFSIKCSSVCHQN